MAQHGLALVVERKTVHTRHAPRSESMAQNIAASVLQGFRVVDLILVWASVRKAMWHGRSLHVHVPSNRMGTMHTVNSLS